MVFIVVGVSWCDGVVLLMFRFGGVLKRYGWCGGVAVVVNSFLWCGKEVWGGG